MKTFKDLRFEEITYTKYYKKQGILNFDNGYGVSVVQGTGTYSNNENQWELAVLKNGELCYDTPITPDVIGWLSEADVTEVMKKVQELEGEIVVENTFKEVKGFIESNNQAKIDNLIGDTELK